MARVVIIGAGLGGLYAAEKLHDAGHEVVVLERLERPGGVWILHEDYAVGDWPWVRFGVTATAIDGKCVATDRGRFCGDVVIEATGFREKTPAELGIFGTRPAGVFALWTAMRMTELGWHIGRRAVIYGCNKWAEGLARRLSDGGVDVEMFGPSFWCRERAVVKELRGSERLAQIVTDRGVIDVDTLVIAEAVPHSWLGAAYRVGNSAIVIDDVSYMRLAVEFFVKTLEGGGFRVYASGLEVFPSVTAGEVVVKVPAPGVVEICGVEAQVSTQYAVFKVREGCALRYVRRS